MKNIGGFTNVGGMANVRDAAAEAEKRTMDKQIELAKSSIKESKETTDAVIKSQTNAEITKKTEESKIQVDASRDSLEDTIKKILDNFHGDKNLESFYKKVIINDYSKVTPVEFITFIHDQGLIFPDPIHGSPNLIEQELVYKILDKVFNETHFDYEKTSHVATEHPHDYVKYLASHPDAIDG